MNETRNQKIQRLKQIRREFNGISQSIANGMGVPQLEFKKDTKLEPLSINSDVKKYIDQVNRTLVINEPESQHNIYQKQLGASSARIKRVNHGFSIINSLRTPRILMKMQTPARPPYLSEEESLAPQNPYNVPSLSPKATFILPPEIVQDSIANKRLNELKHLEYNIQEDERKIINDFANKMNARETHREEIMKQRHKDFIKYGFEESNRRANRAQRIYEIRSMRENDWDWWTSFIDTLQPSTPGIFDLDCLEQLANQDELNEYSVSKVYKKGAKRSPNAKEVYRKTLKLANDYGHFLLPSKLNYAFKMIDDVL